MSCCSDWYHITQFAVGLLFVGHLGIYLTILGLQPGPQRPDSTLINGKGRYAGDPTAALAVVNVKQGLRYRFR